MSFSKKAMKKLLNGMATRKAGNGVLCGYLAAFAKTFESFARKIF